MHFQLLFLATVVSSMRAIGSIEPRRRQSSICCRKTRVIGIANVTFGVPLLHDN
jgi:hypothetical protein